MNKAELITAIASNTDLTKAQAGTALDGLVNVVTDALSSGQKVTVLGFGTFSTAERAARPGRKKQLEKQSRLLQRRCKVQAWKGPCGRNQQLILIG